MKNWILKRNDNAEVLELHGQYWWKDELEWSSKAQSDPEYTIDGAMEIHQGTMLAGRPITLDCTHARINRGDIALLQAWSAVPELELTLTHPNSTGYNVIFDAPYISDIKEIIPIRPEDQQPTDKMRANIHLMTN